MFFNNPFRNFNEFSPSPRTHYAKIVNKFGDYRRFHKKIEKKHLAYIVFFAIFAPSLVSPAMGRRAVLLYEKDVFERGKHLSIQEFPPVNCDSHDILRVLSVLQLDSTNNLFILIKTS
jgi:hypothetical protein